MASKPLVSWRDQLGTPQAGPSSPGRAFVLRDGSLLLLVAVLDVLVDGQRLEGVGVTRNSCRCPLRWGAAQGKDASSNAP